MACCDTYSIYKCLGCIPDMVRVIQKYNLEQYFESYVLNAMFPTKAQWNIIVRTSIKSVEELIAINDIKNIETVLTSNLDSGLQDSSVDIVYIFNSYDMIRNKKKLHDEINRILKKDGKLVIRNTKRLLTSDRKYKKIFDIYDNMTFEYKDKQVYYYKKINSKKTNFK